MHLIQSEKNFLVFALLYVSLPVVILKISVVLLLCGQLSVLATPLCGTHFSIVCAFPRYQIA